MIWPCLTIQPNSLDPAMLFLMCFSALVPSWKVNPHLSFTAPLRKSLQPLLPVFFSFGSLPPKREGFLHSHFISLPPLCLVFLFSTHHPICLYVTPITM